jgi:hypothetical protein
MQPPKHKNEQSWKNSPAFAYMRVIAGAACLIFVLCDVQILVPQNLPRGFDNGRIPPEGAWVSISRSPAAIAIGVALLVAGIYRLRHRRD